MFNVVSQIYLCRERMARDWSRVKPKLYTDTSPYLRGCAWNESTIRLIIRFILQNPSHIYCTKVYPMALRCLFPLSGLLTASLPHVFESSGRPFVPNPILESHEPHSFLFSLTIPILALEYLLQLQTTLNPSLLQLACNEPWESNQLFPLVTTKWGGAVLAISDQWVQRVSLLVDDNEPELLVDLHTETDLGEGCVPVGG